MTNMAIKLFSPSQARIPIGTVVIAGRSYDVAVNIEWARYFDSMTTATNDNTEALGTARNGGDGPAMGALTAGGDDSVEFIPGPQGAQGARGEGGPAVGFLINEDASPEFIPGPPGPQGAKGEPGPALFMLQDPDMNDIFWPIKA